MIDKIRCFTLPVKGVPLEIGFLGEKAGSFDEMWMNKSMEDIFFRVTFGGV